MDEMVFLVFGLLVLIFSAVMHEVSQGAAAYSLGDPTAKMMGRLTFNPLPHIDLYGSVILPAFMLLVGSPVVFGYAKPVPVNLDLLRDRVWGPSLVALAGPGSNFALAAGLGFLYQLGNAFVGIPIEIATLFQYAILINFALGFFNSLPSPPLDGFKIITPLLPYEILRSEVYQGFQQYGMIFLLVFILFGGEIIGPVIVGATQFVMGI